MQHARVRRTTVLWSIAFVAAMLAGAPAATAQGPPVATRVVWDCDQSTGRYDVAVTVTDQRSLAATLSGTYRIQIPEDGGTGPLLFEPTVLPAGGTSTAVFSVPGTTSLVFIDFEVTTDGTSEAVFTSAEIGDDCVADPPPEPVASTSTAPSTASEPGVGSSGLRE